MFFQFKRWRMCCLQSSVVPSSKESIPKKFHFSELWSRQSPQDCWKIIFHHSLQVGKTLVFVKYSGDNWPVSNKCHFLMNRIRAGSLETKQLVNNSWIRVNMLSSKLSSHLIKTISFVEVDKAVSSLRVAAGLQFGFHCLQLTENQCLKKFSVENWFELKEMRTWTVEFELRQQKESVEKRQTKSNSTTSE